MKAWKITNRKTNVVRGIAYESMLDACKDEKDLPVFAYILQQTTLQAGEAYVPKEGKSPAFAD